MTSPRDESYLSKDTFSGELWKRGKINKGWKLRHIVVDRLAQTLAYYSSESDVVFNRPPCGTVTLSTIIKIIAVTEHNAILIDKLPEFIQFDNKLKSDREFTFHLHADGRTFVFSAADTRQFTRWIKYLQSCVYGGVVKEGWLHKQGSLNKKSWKSRYFVLNKYCQLKYYATKQRAQLSGLIDCTQIRSITNGTDKNDCQFILNTKARKWTITAQSEEDRVWCTFCTMTCILCFGYCRYLNSFYIFDLSEGMVSAHRGTTRDYRNGRK